MKHMKCKSVLYIQTIGSVWLLIMISSCNSFIQMELTAYTDSENTVTLDSVQSSTTVQDSLQANVDIQINIAHFFIEYLGDLLGINGIDDFVQQIELASYLASRDNVTELEVTTERAHASNNNIDSIYVTFISTALFSTMKSLHMPFTVTEDREVQFEISREFIVSLLNNFSELADNDLVSVFMPDPVIVVEKDFPEYIAWSFTEYLDDVTVRKMVRDSVIQVMLTKGEGVDTPLPDVGWEKIGRIEGAQNKTFSLVSLLYSEHNTLQFLY